MVELTKDREDAIIKEHGSVDYAQTYINNYADFLIFKFKEKERSDNILLLIDKTDEEIATLVKAREEKAVEESK